MNLKIKYGKVKTKKLDKETFLSMRRAADLLTELKMNKDAGDDLKSSLQQFVQSIRKKNRVSKQETPVTFFREIRGLGEFEFNAKKTTSTNMLSIYKEANEHIKTAIKQKRTERKKINVSTHTHSTSDGEVHQITKLGPNAVRNIIDTKTGKKIDEAYLNAGVFAEKGTILRIMKWKHCKTIFNAKSPTDDKNYVGIELEFYCTVVDKVLAYDLYEQGLLQYLSLASDGSIRPEANMIGHELRILAPEADIEMVITKVCATLKKYGAKVNKTCGTHVHLDMRNRQHKTVFTNLVKSQKILYKMNPKSRKEGQYSKPTEHSDLDKAVANNSDGRGGRYWGINFAALSRHQTFEVRIHAGMIDATKIINWVKLLVHVVNMDKVAPEYKTLAGFFKKFSIPEELKEYIKQRIELTQEGELEIEEAA